MPLNIYIIIIQNYVNWTGNLMSLPRKLCYSKEKAREEDVNRNCTLYLLINIIWFKLRSGHK